MPLNVVDAVQAQALLIEVLIYLKGELAEQAKTIRMEGPMC